MHRSSGTAKDENFEDRSFTRLRRPVGRRGYACRAENSRSVAAMRRLLVRALTLGFGVLLANAFANDGDLDPNYGYVGTVYFYWSGYLDALFGGGTYIDENAVSVLAQADGKTIIVGAIRYQDAALNERMAIGLARLTTGGQFDNTFGDAASSGEAVLAAPGTDSWSPFAATLGIDGSIVIAGQTTHASDSTRTITVWRVTPAGKPDTTLGGTGSVTIDRGAAAPQDKPGAVIVGDGSNEPLNSIFVGASVSESPYLHSDFALFFLDASGAPLVVGSTNIGNQSLPNSGRWWRGSASCPGLSDGTGFTAIAALAFDPQFFAGLTAGNHYLLAAGSCYSFSGGVTTAAERAVVIAFDDQTNLDANFGGGGYSYFTFGSSIATDPSMANAMRLSFRPDGTELITVAGVDMVSEQENHPGVARLLGNGQFDMGFGAGGHLTINVGACCGLASDLDHSEARALLLQADGKAVLGVKSSLNAGPYFRALLRLDTDGGGDATFGSVGLLAGAGFYHIPIEQELPLGSGLYASGTIRSMAFTAGEEIVAAGLSTDGTNTANTYAGLIRVKNDRIMTSGFEGVPLPK
jgi:uncharacterized delta-60 repeat protein